MFRKYLIIIALFTTTTASAQVDSVTTASGATKKIEHNDSTPVTKRPKVGLVLSGGGAKGMAHIGILKKLEEVGIYPDYITGTSMGSIIGALYSIGYSIDELEAFAKETKWLELMTNSLDSKLISIKQKDDYGWWPLEITFENHKPVLLSGMLEAPNLSNFFSKNTWRTVGINKFDDYPIPFRCYGVDILKGNTVEFSEGDLARAIRGSMAIPLVFSPVLIENQTDTLLIVDGGVMHNFPVKDVIDMGADIVIGAYTGFEDEVTADEMNSITKITGRVLMFGGVNDSKEQMKLLNPKYLITPDLKGIQPSDFLKADKIIKRGEDAANEHLADLKKLADSLNAIEPRKRPDTLVCHDTIVVDHVVVNGLEYTNKETAYGIIDITDNQKVTSSMIEESITRLYATLLYKSIYYSITTNDDGKITLTFNVKEKGLTQFSVGGYYDNIYNIGLTLKFSQRNFLWKHYDAYVFANINKYPGVKVQISRNVGKKDVWTLYSKAEWNSDFKTIYTGSKRRGDLDFMHASWDLAGGSRTIGNYTLAEASPLIEFFLLDSDEDNNISEDIPPYTSCFQEGIRLAVKHNTLDNNLYPKNGIRWHIEAKGIFNANEKIDGYDDVSKNVADLDRKYLKLSTDFECAFTINYDRWKNTSTTLVPWAAAGISTKQIIGPDKFYLGGFEYNMRYGQTPFIGLQPNQVCTNNFSAIGLTVRQEIHTYFNAVVRINALAAYDELTDLKKPTVSSIGIGAGILIRTPIGPICFLRATDSYLIKDYYYFNIGFNLPYIK
jgi:NTE family protein